MVYGCENCKKVLGFAALNFHGQRDGVWYLNIAAGVGGSHGSEIFSEDEQYRQTLRTWLEANRPQSPPKDQDAEFAYRRVWQRKLYEGGWVGINWPKEYGGQGATLIQQAIYAQEMARARAPQPANGLGIGIVGPTLMHHGTEEQKNALSPKFSMLTKSGARVFRAQLGLDLASLQTKAVLDGDDFVVNGQKIWTSMGQYADWCILLVRTDSNAPKHRGISSSSWTWTVLASLLDL